MDVWPSLISLAQPLDSDLIQRSCRTVPELIPVHSTVILPIRKFRLLIKHDVRPYLSQQNLVFDNLMWKQYLLNDILTFYSNLKNMRSLLK